MSTALDGEAEQVLSGERECLAGVDHRWDGDAADGVGHGCEGAFGNLLRGLIHLEAKCRVRWMLAQTWLRGGPLVLALVLAFGHDGTSLRLN